MLKIVWNYFPFKKGGGGKLIEQKCSKKK